MRSVFLILFLLLIAGLMTNQSLWLDEATSVKAASLGVSKILTEFAPNDFHPPLYYILLHYWILIGGSGEGWVRLLSVVLTFLTMLLVYGIGKIIVGNKFGTLAGVLFGTGPLVFYYSGEARMYALAMMLVTLSIFGFVKFLESRNWRWWMLWVLGMTLSIYTDYLPILVQPVFFLALFWSEAAKRAKKAIIFGLLVELLLFAPWLPTLFYQLANGAIVQSVAPGWWKILGPLSLKSLALLWVKMVIGRISFFNKFIYASVVGIMSLIFGGALVFAIRRRAKLGIIWMWLLIPVLVGAIVALRLAIFQYFRFLFIAPAFYLLVAAGASKLGKRVAILLITINLVFDAIYILNPRFYREDWRGVTNYIRKNRTESSVVLFPNSGQADGYRYYSSPVPVVEPKAWYESRPSRVWLFRYVQEIFDPQDTLRKGLENMGYHKIEEKSFNQVLVWRYEKL